MIRLRIFSYAQFPDLTYSRHLSHGHVRSCCYPYRLIADCEVSQPATRVIDIEQSSYWTSQSSSPNAAHSHFAAQLAECVQISPLAAKNSALRNGCYTSLYRIAYGSSLSSCLKFRK